MINCSRVFCCTRKSRCATQDLSSEGIPNDHICSRIAPRRSSPGNRTTVSYRRDLNLELSRALYEMEVEASLGRSMTLQSKARMNDEALNYCQNLTWAKLNALQGQDVLTPPSLKAEAN